MYCHLEALVQVVSVGTMESTHLIISVMKKQFCIEASTLNWNPDIRHGMILSWNSSDWYTPPIIWDFSY